MKKSWHQIFELKKKDPQMNNREVAAHLEMASSRVNYQVNQQKSRNQNEASIFWESESGQNFLKRLIVGVLYTFGIKGGVGAGRIEEFFERIRLYTHVGISSSSILRMIKEIELSILRYKELCEHNIMESKEYKAELKLVLGLDETWLDSMLLVCQELSSGYLFLNKAQKREIPKVGGKS